jgi:hypothetical protein
LVLALSAFAVTIYQTLIALVLATTVVLVLVTGIVAMVAGSAVLVGWP